ncbi:MAG: carboxypeptidase-like regulatory domain-containing protein [Acidobacteriaceae bacterium]
MLSGSVLLGSMTFGAMMIAGPMLGGSFAAAQTASAQRTIEGKVVDSNDAPTQGAIVYLKNDKTLEVRTYISTQGGVYRFGQLSSGSDYSIWAEYQGKKSKTRSISSFDEKRVFDITLKVDTAK